MQFILDFLRKKPSGAVSGTAVGRNRLCLRQKGRRDDRYFVARFAYRICYYCISKQSVIKNSNEFVVKIHKRELEIEVGFAYNEHNLEVIFLTK